MCGRPKSINPLWRDSHHNKVDVAKDALQEVSISSLYI